MTDFLREENDMILPNNFLYRMQKLLGNEFDDFVAALDEHSVKGLRINSLKCNEEDILKDFSYQLTPISYVKGGYIIDNPEGIGNTPEHHCGAFYVQDPGAMSAVSALDIKPGMFVADLCAAPGGKSTQLASLIGHEGFILSNEYVPKRAKILVSNFERMGVRSYVITSLDTAEIAKLYEGVFDVVVADAPCSGEGMFRKDVPAVEEWSEENVLICSERQREILNNAATLVKPMGHLLYSTCTYSLEENEMTVDNFLKSHPEFELVPVREALYATTSDGITFDGAVTKNLNLCRRFYPHKAKGEGQFVALLQRTRGDTKTTLCKDAAKAPTKEEVSATENFFRENLCERPEGKIAKYGENLVLISHSLPSPPHSVFSAGVLIGELKGKVLVPSHQFFSAYGALFKRRENVSDSDTVKKYLAGEEIEAKTVTGTGFVAVLWNNTALGGGKLVDGKIKNHYPKGLRIR